MPGFETNRFVNLDEKQLKHLICGICLSVFNKPIDTQCKHTFCSDCISHWTQRRNTCPQCRQQLEYNHMFSETTRSFINLINDLQIKCEFHRKGCQVIVCLELLSKHLEECDYNICVSCGLKMGKTQDHNCLQLLKRENERLLLEMSEKLSLDFFQKQDLKRKCNELLEQNRRLRSENFRFRKTLRSVEKTKQSFNENSVEESNETEEQTINEEVIEIFDPINQNMNIEMTDIKPITK